MKYLNNAPQYNICPGRLFTQCHLTGEEENLHLGIALQSSRSSPSSRSRTACQKAGLSPSPPGAPCTSPVHLPATLFGLVHPGGGRPRSPRRVGGRPSLHVGSLLQSPSIFSSPPSREGLKMNPPPWHFSKNSSDLVARSFPSQSAHL